MDSRGLPFTHSTPISPRHSSPDRQHQNFISPGSFPQYEDPSQTSSAIPQPLPPTSNAWQTPMSSVQPLRRNSDYNQYAPNMPDSSYVSPRSLSPQQMYQGPRHRTSGLQEWDGSSRQTGHQSMSMPEDVPSQYRQQQSYQPYDYQGSYQSGEQYAQYPVGAVTSTPSSSSSSSSPQATDDRPYLPSLQYPQSHHYAPPPNSDYISREDFIQTPALASSSYAVGHVPEYRGSGSQSGTMYTSPAAPVDHPTSFPLRQVGAPAPSGPYDTSYGLRRSPPENSGPFRAPTPPKIAYEPTEVRHRSESFDSRRGSVDTMSLADHDYSSTTGLPPQKPKRRRADANQLRVLNEVYARTAFPSTEERIELGRRLGMSPRQVQIWFQNRRQNAKAGRGPPLGTPSEYQNIPYHPAPPSAYREIVKPEPNDMVDPRFGQPQSAYPGSRVPKREYE